MTTRVPRRTFLAGTIAAGTSAILDPRHMRAATKRRVIILGFDGVAPAIIDQMLERGELPNMSRLAKAGQYERLRSTIPPQSPTAWASFTTCTNPGAHGIFDFIRRDPGTYLPAVGYGQARHATLNPKGALARPAHFESLRRGIPFWVTADAHGIRSKIINMPYAFPPDKLDNGIMLCSLGVPTIQGTENMFYWISDAFSPDELKRRPSGGMRLPLVFENGHATVRVPGARDLMKSDLAYIEVPIGVVADRKTGSVTVDVQGQQATLRIGSWSDWFVWHFRVTPDFSVPAISRFYLLQAGERIDIYMNSLQFHPDDPYIPFTAPETYAKTLKDRYGLYKTQGWAYDTHALRQDALTEHGFLQDVQQTMEWRRRLVLDEMMSDEWQMLVAVWTATDRVAHLFWRYRDPNHPLYDDEQAQRYGKTIEQVYQTMDSIVGDVMHQLSDDDLLMVMSDHAFHSFRHGFNVNTWLIRQGHLNVPGQSDPTTATNKEPYLQGYDWSRTRAYGIGFSSIYLNLKGRESRGGVGENDAESFRNELRDALLAVRDPRTNDRVFTGIYFDRVYHGDAKRHAPDLVLGYAEGYQSTKSAAKGCAPSDLFEPNTDKWSGDHVGSDIEISSGMLFANRIMRSDAAIIDLGSTALDYLGIPIPDSHEGKSLLSIT